jgi:hypothetical protein
MRSTAKFRQESQDPSSPAYGNRPLSSTIANVTSEAPHPQPAENAGPPAPSRVEVWLNRIFLAVFVLVCALIGIMLVILPWTKYWTENTILLHNLSLRELAVNDFVRGAVSGLGLVDVWIGIQEGVSYLEAGR